MNSRLLAGTQFGFTYLWTLFAVAFVGIGMMVTAELWTTTVKREREVELIYAGRQFRDAIGRYYESTPGVAKQYPPSLEELLHDSRFPSIKRHLRKIFPDPVTGKPDWELVRLNGRIVGIKSRSIATPIKVAGFDWTESSFQGKEKYADWIFTYPHDLLLRPASNNKSLPGASTVLQPLNPAELQSGMPAGTLPGAQGSAFPTLPENSSQFPPHQSRDLQTHEPNH